jgi:hypothetical protein
LWLFTSAWNNIMSRLIRMTQGLLLAGALIATSAGAEIYYKWDKDGITQYTKEKPRDVPSEEVRTIGGRAPGGPGSSAAPATASSTGSQESADPAAAPARKDPKMCERAKANLETLQSTAIVRMKDEYGKEVVMDDKLRDEQIKRAQEAIKTNC